MLKANLQACARVCGVQVTTLLGRHDKALAEGVVTEQQLQHLQQQVSNQGSVLRVAKEAAKADASQQSKHQVIRRLQPPATGACDCARGYAFQACLHCHALLYSLLMKSWIQRECRSSEQQQIGLSQESVFTSAGLFPWGLLKVPWRPPNWPDCSASHQNHNIHLSWF